MHQLKHFMYRLVSKFDFLPSTWLLGLYIGMAGSNCAFGDNPHVRFSVELRYGRPAQGLVLPAQVR